MASTTTSGTLTNVYTSKYTGEEVEAALDNAAQINTFLQANLIPPVGVFTGDYLTTAITTITQSMWLESIVLVSIRAFSTSADTITYTIATGGGTTLLTIPNNFMRSTGTTLVYPIHQLFDPDTTFNMVCDSTRAYGEIHVKLLFG